MSGADFEATRSGGDSEPVEAPCGVAVEAGLEVRQALALFLVDVLREDVRALGHLPDRTQIGNEARLELGRGNDARIVAADVLAEIPDRPPDHPDDFFATFMTVLIMSPHPAGRPTAATVGLRKSTQ